MEKKTIRQIKLKQLIDALSNGVIADFAKKIDKEPSYISRMLYNFDKPGAKSIGEQMADHICLKLGLPPHWLDSLDSQLNTKLDYTHQLNVTEPNAFYIASPSKQFPLLSNIQAGVWTGVSNLQDSTGYDFLSTSLDDPIPSKDSFFLKIVGDSMEPEFFEGDIVLIDPSIKPLPGEFVAAVNGSHEATFKKYKEVGVLAESGTVHFELIPLNEDYSIISSQTQEIKIIGTMIEHRSYRRKR